MSDDRPTRDSISIKESTISNMSEIAAIVEVLELCRTLEHSYSPIAHTEEIETSWREVR